MTITRLCHVRMTTAMVKTRTKVVETTGSQVIITEAGKEMIVLTIINNLRKICACLFITNNLQENHVAWRQNDREKSRNNIDGQQNHRNNDRDDQSDMWSCPLHLSITIGDSTNGSWTLRNHPLHLIIYIEDRGGRIRHEWKGQWKTRRSSDTVGRWRRGARRSTEEWCLNRKLQRMSTEECSHKKEWRPSGRHSTIKSWD